MFILLEEEDRSPEILLLWLNYNVFVSLSYYRDDHIIKIYNLNIAMSNAVLIVLACIFVAILIAINIYILALYVHTDDKGFGTALYCKILVVLGLTLCQAQALLVPLDVANNSAQNSYGIDMKGFWLFIYAVVLIFITLLLPFALFFYETD